MTVSGTMIGVGVGLVVVVAFQGYLLLNLHQQHGEAQDSLSRARGTLADGLAKLGPGWELPEMTEQLATYEADLARFAEGLKLFGWLVFVPFLPLLMRPSQPALPPSKELWPSVQSGLERLGKLAARWKKTDYTFDERSLRRFLDALETKLGGLGSGGFRPKLSRDAAEAAIAMGRRALDAGPARLGAARLHVLGCAESIELLAKLLEQEASERAIARSGAIVSAPRATPATTPSAPSSASSDDGTSVFERDAPGATSFGASSYEPATSASSSDSSSSNDTWSSSSSDSGAGYDSGGSDSGVGGGYHGGGGDSGGGGSSTEW